MQQGRPNHLPAVGYLRGHATGREVSVPLIDHRLVEKRAFFAAFYPLTDACNLGRGEGF